MFEILGELGVQLNKEPEAEFSFGEKRRAG